MENATAQATYRDVAGNVVALEIVGIVNPNNGWVWFNKTVADGPLTLTFNYNVNPNALANAIYNGSTTIQNNSSNSVKTAFTVEFDLCPKIIASSHWGGTANVKLVANTNGGQITCGDSNSLTGVLADGAPVFSLYWCPFTMSTTGAGVAQTNTTFGQPIPSAAGPATVESIGHFADFAITDGDTAIFTAYTVAAGEAEHMPSPSCPFDINGDGVVDKWDLIALLQSFGSAGSCLAADLNGDGVVDGLDLGLLVGMWGLCAN